MAYPLQRLSASQRLTASQLAIVIARPELPNYVKDSVSVNQRILQVPHSVWREAGRIARVERQSLIPHLNVNLGSS